MSLDEIYDDMLDKQASVFITNNVDLIQEVNSHARVDPFASDLSGFVYRCRCPFATHTDFGTPMLLNPSRKMYYCSDCCVAGNVSGFIQLKLDCSPGAANRYLANKYDLELPRVL